MSFLGTVGRIAAGVGTFGQTEVANEATSGGLYGKDSTAVSDSSGAGQGVLGSVFGAPQLPGATQVGASAANPVGYGGAPSWTMNVGPATGTVGTVGANPDGSWGTAGQVNTTPAYLGGGPTAAQTAAASAGQQGLTQQAYAQGVGNGQATQSNALGAGAANQGVSLGQVYGAQAQQAGANFQDQASAMGRGLNNQATSVGNALFNNSQNQAAGATAQGQGIYNTAGQLGATLGQNAAGQQAGAQQTGAGLNGTLSAIGSGIAGQQTDYGNAARGAAASYGGVAGQDYGQQNQARGMELSGINDIQRFSQQGAGPSVAAAQLAQQSDAIMGQNLALAHSGRGAGANAEAMRQAQWQNAAQQQVTNQQAAGLSAQEQATWRQTQLGAMGTAQNALGAVRGQDAGIYGQNLGAQQGQGQLGQAYDANAAQYQMGGAQAGANAQLGYGQLGQAYGAQGQAGQLGAMNLGAGAVANAGQLAAAYSGQGVGAQSNALNTGVGAQTAMTGLGINANAGMIAQGQTVQQNAINQGNALQANYNAQGNQAGQFGVTAGNQAAQYGTGLQNQIATTAQQADAQQSQFNAQLQQQAALASAGYTNAADIAQGKLDLQNKMAWLDTAATVGGAAAKSDERAKTNIKAAAYDLRDAKGYSYDYKDPGSFGAGAGRFFGPMAQDLEKSEAGRSVVKTGPDGLKIVDTSRLSLVNTAAISEIQRTLDRIARGA